MGRVHRVASVLALAIAVGALAVLGGCQSAPQVAPQRGPDSGAQSSPITPSAPVDQHGVLIVSPTVVMAGPGSPDGKLPTVTITVGPQANGDVKGLGKQEGGAQSSSNTLSQTSSPTQDVNPEAVAKAATDLLATVAPASEAANLATAALDAARAGDGSKAKELVARARAVAGKEKTSGSAEVGTSSTENPPK
jgi:hypothetical protein